MPRAALLSIHARVEGTQPTAWEDPSLVQVWGPRFSAYVVAAVDAAVFTLGRLPDDPAGLKRAESTADRLEAFLDGRTMSYADAGHGIGIDPNALRHGAPTGRIRIRWEGARRPTIWTVPGAGCRTARGAARARPSLSDGPRARDGRHVFRMGRHQGSAGPRIFDDLAPELTAVRTPSGDGWILAADEPSFGRAATEPDPSVVRLLPSGDAWFLLWGAARALLVPDAARRGELWTSRVWPGAILVGGEIAGVWRRAAGTVSLSTWRALSPTERDAVVAEAESLPLPDVPGPIRVSWEDAAV